MSTTLVPPTHYLVTVRGRSEGAFATLADAALPLAKVVPTPVAVTAVTGQRSRPLHPFERRQLLGHVRALRDERSGEGP